MNTIAALGGRKFLVAVLAVIAVVLQERFNISPDATMMVGGIAIAYILGQGAVDAATKGATSSTSFLREREENQGE